MQNFTFHNPTKIFFGKGQIKKRVGTETAKYGKKALFVYGQQSVKKNGVYNQVVDALKESGVAFVEWPGVKSNPVLSHVEAGIELACKENVDVILGVGGGSVIDSAKAIAAGVKANHSVWDFFTFAQPVRDALPILAVATVSASASEMNNGTVLTKEDCCHKFGIASPLFQPKVSVLDPTTLFSLDKKYSAYSSIDAIAHMLEAYLNTPVASPVLQDRLHEGLIKTIIESTDIVMKQPDNYEARANIMWGSVVGFNGITTAGMGFSAFPAHMIEHALSALYDIAHGAGLSIVLPAWMSWALENKKERMARFAREVFGVKENDPLQAAREGVGQLKSWFSSLGAPVSLKEANIPADDIAKIAANALNNAQMWKMTNYTKEVISEILTIGQ
ncbi:MAG TPA: iron-containing alcohol dehydrogenase [Smithellaceae bacterium]|nr:iron-containing alcohol dehydrogenase [Smithellaceae bacterium]HRS89582.1 iron-containing alcohol dehydrogenase [Smithellaceae bacterium]HRV26357.1 iron-containing alcohol dehydrogenase [Smithellaceae bacterium]